MGADITAWSPPYAPDQFEHSYTWDRQKDSPSSNWSLLRAGEIEFFVCVLCAVVFWYCFSIFWEKRVHAFGSYPPSDSRAQCFLHWARFFLRLLIDGFLILHYQYYHASWRSSTGLLRPPYLSTYIWQTSWATSPSYIFARSKITIARSFSDSP